MDPIISICLILHKNKFLTYFDLPKLEWVGEPRFIGSILIFSEIEHLMNWLLIIKKNFTISKLAIIEFKNSFLEQK